LKIKHLLDVGKALKIKELMRVVGFVITQFLEFVKFTKRIRKGCGKVAEKSKSLKIKHLLNFFPHFRISKKPTPKTHPHP